MGIIKVLSEITANKIAAGEVVERPASVVKELVENSLDAGASNIIVSTQYGGKSQITIKDDGHGMDTADAVACLQRHATSKISDVEDIEEIKTLGFRGEALPSIASVSQLLLTTRQKHNDTAVQVQVSGGTVEGTSECVAPAGTTIEVTELFFNIPARKKFLKSELSENNAITDIFNTLSLSRPDVSFTLSRNKNEIANYPACKSLLKRIEQVYPPDFAARMHEINVEKPDFSLSGYIGSPENTRINRTGQKIFINNRPVYSATLSTALIRAYDEFIPQKRFPVAVLFLEIDGSLVDVNVHPSKKEVRIRNERYFQSSIISTIRKILNQHGVYPKQGVSGEGFYDRFPFHKKENTFSSPGIRETNDKWQQEVNRQEALTEDLSKASPKNIPEHQFLMEQEGYIEPFGIKNILGQILNTYIIAETRQGCIVFDQHAAHERILYEEILESFSKQSSTIQQMILPLTLHLELGETEAMKEYMPFFQDTGFSINPLGGNTFSIDAVPAFLPGVDVENTVMDTLHELMEKSSSKIWENLQQHFAAILACKTYSVKAGRHLVLQEMEHLLKKLGTTKNPHTCPHGRPTFFVMSGNDLAQRFKRK